MIGKRKAKGRMGGGGGGGGGVGRKKILCSLLNALPGLSPFPIFLKENSD